MIVKLLALIIRAICRKDGHFLIFKSSAAYLMATELKKTTQVGAKRADLPPAVTAGARYILPKTENASAVKTANATVVRKLRADTDSLY